MSQRRELHCYDYVNQPLAAVRTALLADPLSIFERATTNATAGEAHAELRVKLGALDIGAEVAIRVGTPEEGRSPVDKPATKLPIEWTSSSRPGLFPVMKATLSIYALSPTETQLELSGTYDPPLGLFGDAVDAMALHKFAEAAVAGFVRDVAVYLRQAGTVA